MRHHHALLALLGTTALSEAVVMPLTEPRTDSATPLAVVPAYEITVDRKVHTAASDAEVTDLVIAGDFTDRGIDERAEDSGHARFCGLLGIGCGSVNDETAGSVENVDSKRDPDPQGLSFCGPPGVSCGQGGPELDERDAIQDTGVIGFCGPPGMNCADNVEPTIVPVGKLESDAVGAVSLCGPLGVSCGNIEERDAQPMPESSPEAGGIIGFCGPPGIGCGSGEKRDADADADADTYKGGPVGFCGQPGVICPTDGDHKNRRERDLFASKSDGSMEFFSSLNKQPVKHFTTTTTSLQPTSNTFVHQMMEENNKSSGSGASRMALLATGMAFAVVIVAMQFFLVIMS
ncbi:hypothetical protein K431DRAFT_350040 [Polychaeton citri CBS 116435]|uniref:Uncharacterized protein n=1 Tax=Polychaeton citri CBS 116435 TaxID=1314669 RepID=A0A9P4UIG9_9PEZI|nr:hypothetical protein K431DRAFT_350040 [Polychaeton citri CBS 116435]